MGYTLTFKTLAEKTVVVKIDGGGTTLTGAANPVTIDEDDDNDLLNVIRTKTGYLNLVETVDGELDGIYPQTNTEKTIEVTCDSKMIFSGYLQAQNFDRSLTPCPRSVSIPIISKLGVIAEKNINAIKNAGNTRLGVVMKEICTNLGYEYIFVPSSLLANDVNPMQVSINNRKMSPFNDEYRFGTGDVFAPMSYEEFMEAFCNLYGVIAHDIITENSGVYAPALMFTRINYSGGYSKMAAASLDNASYTGIGVTPSSLIFDTLFNVSENQAKETNLLPLGRLDINHGEYDDDVEMNLRLATCGERPAVRVGNVGGVDGKVLFLLPISTADGNEFSTEYFDDSSASYSGYPPEGTTRIRVPGTGSNEYIEISQNITSITQTQIDTPLFEYKFGVAPRSDFSLIFKTLHGLSQYRLCVKYGNKYLKSAVGGGYEWTTTATVLQPNYQQDNGIVLDGIPAVEGPVTVQVLTAVYTVGSVSRYKDDPVSELTLTVKGNPLSEYYDKRIDPTRTIKLQGHFDETSIDMQFHDYINNKGRIVGGSLLAQNDYDYMFRPLRVSTITARRTLVNTYNMETLMMATYTINETSGWKLLAIGMEPWNDDLLFTFVK